MNDFINKNKHISHGLEITTISVLSLSLLSLSIIGMDGNLSAIILYFLMLLLGVMLIGIFSSQEEKFLKFKLFIFFFSIYVTYMLAHHYILLSISPNIPPYDFLDEHKFYEFSDLGLPYISGEKNFFDLFSVYEVHQLPLHVVFSSLITYFSVLIDGHNTIIVQKLLSPFFGGMFSVVLFSTLKHQFQDSSFSFNATIGYGLLSAVFMYSTTLLRDIDVALAYMIFIYLFLQLYSYKNFFLLMIIAFFTVYLRAESGMVLFATTLLYAYLYVRTLQSRSIKLIFYIILIGLFTFVILLMFNKIIGMIVVLNEANSVRGLAQSSTGSLSLLFDKLPFGVSHLAKVLFAQMQPFPFFLAINRPIEALSGLLWPFVFIMMTYAIWRKNIRDNIDIKVKYLLLIAIAVLFLMSSEANTRRMMSVYPVIYITSLYVFLILPQNKIKRAITYYLFGIISLNTFYYLIKV